jgi:hypothetical protein
VTYHPLTEDTGQTPERRAEEARDIVRMLDDLIEQMEPHEGKFVASMEGADKCSPKQLFWLRDLKDKYL